MSGNLITTGSTISCPHGGRVAAVSGTASGATGVRVDGALLPAPGDAFRVTGCPHTVGGVPDPCLSVRWMPVRSKGVVLVDGEPLLSDATAALCLNAALVPQGAPAVAAPSGRGVRVR
ncbi:hypothetical protein AB0O07_02800 [Streptomyces sp. NPDC093085]|uniref:hypothetical protein n=1 Tax=Streptomyces sp. NPDC093085 TaxID=3155068 RepID=UPI0034431B53